MQFKIQTSPPCAASSSISTPFITENKARHTQTTAITAAINPLAGQPKTKAGIAAFIKNKIGKIDERITYFEALFILKIYQNLFHYFSLKKTINDLE